METLSNLEYLNQLLISVLKNLYRLNIIEKEISYNLIKLKFSDAIEKRKPKISVQKSCYQFVKMIKPN